MDGHQTHVFCHPEVIMHKVAVCNPQKEKMKNGFSSMPNTFVARISSKKNRKEHKNMRFCHIAVVKSLNAHLWLCIPLYVTVTVSTRAQFNFLLFLCETN